MHVEPPNLHRTDSSKPAPTFGGVERLLIRPALQRHGRAAPGAEDKTGVVLKGRKTDVRKARSADDARPAHPPLPPPFSRWPPCQAENTGSGEGSAWLVGFSIR